MQYHLETELMIVLYILLILAIAFFFGWLFIGTARFGSLASAERLTRIQSSHFYKNGAFQNLSVTPDLTDGATFYTVFRDFLFRNSKRAMPQKSLPSIKTDLHTLKPSENVLVWFGHSSYFMQVDGKKILVDPVFSGNASPFKFTTKSFAGSDIYSASDFPPIDYLILSHDHWDHLDYNVLRQLKNKIKMVVTGLGTGAHLERWGFSPSVIHEMEWNEEFVAADGFRFNSVPARHFLGRGLKRNQALWSSFVLQTPSLKIFIGGDSGYDSHFKTIGEAFGPFDLVILECGQYNKSWKHIHMMPEEVVLAAEDLKAKMLLPVHWGKFVLALHDWDEPISRVVQEATIRNMPVVHPMIGEKLLLKGNQQFSKWWTDY
jgi:L-ascorbate metabolism protein UlaG (beta-lactamase superfamily)